MRSKLSQCDRSQLSRAIVFITSIHSVVCMESSAASMRTSLLSVHMMYI